MGNEEIEEESCTKLGYEKKDKRLLCVCVCVCVF